jgi:hypothetical protein
MTIRKGQEWGHFESRPADLQVVADDFSASELISSQTLDVKSPLQLSIIKSGLNRTLGVKNAPHHNQQMKQISLLSTPIKLYAGVSSGMHLFVRIHSSVKQSRF